MGMTRRQKAPRRPARISSSTSGGDGHDYRDCFYDSQGDWNRAASDCPRYPCRVYREGHQHGYAAGQAAQQNG